MTSGEDPSAHEPVRPAPGRVARALRAVMPRLARRGGPEVPSHRLPIPPEDTPELPLTERIIDIDAAQVVYGAEHLLEGTVAEGSEPTDTEPFVPIKTVLPDHDQLHSVDPRTLRKLLHTVPRDNHGDLVPSQDQRLAIVGLLQRVPGLVGSFQVSPIEMNMAIARGQGLVSAQRAVTLLQRLRFVDKQRLPNDGSYDTTTIHMQGDLSIDPDRVVSAFNLRNWTGMGYNRQGVPFGKREDDDRDKPQRPSLDTILDYANRPTPLPPLHIMDMYLTDQGMFAATNDSHRTAAAQLRREPLRIDVMHLHDLRVLGVSEESKRRAENALRATVYNTQLQDRFS